MKNIKLLITPAIWARATQYTDKQHCPIAEAIREQFPDTFIEVYNRTLMIGLQEYKILPVDNGYWSFGQYSPVDVDEYIRMAKDGQDVPTVEINLEAIES